MALIDFIDIAGRFIVPSPSARFSIKQNRVETLRTEN